jgi:hypothetical protein
MTLLSDARFVFRLITFYKPATSRVVQVKRYVELRHPMATGKHAIDTVLPTLPFFRPILCHFLTVPPVNPNIPKERRAIASLPLLQRNLSAILDGTKTKTRKRIVEEVAEKHMGPIPKTKRKNDRQRSKIQEQGTGGGP